MELTNNVHIGDGVYISFDGYHLILKANNPVTDTVYLDFSVRAELFRILKAEFEKESGDG